MWFERQTPVLTTELKEDLPSSLVPLEKLQDVIGTLVKIEIKPKRADHQETKQVVNSTFTNSASEKN